MVGWLMPGVQSGTGGSGGDGFGPSTGDGTAPDDLLQVVGAALEMMKLCALWRIG